MRATYVFWAALILIPLCPPVVRAETPLVQTGPLSFAPLVRRVTPAVVSISVHIAAAPRKSHHGAEPPQAQAAGETQSGAGAGFILDPSGVIVTNNHVVGSASQIMVTLSDGSKFAARLIGHDELTDIAVIKIAAGRRLPSVAWGDSKKVEVGDWILAAGNPFGLGGSVTAGIVSARGREIGAGPFDDFFQLDAPINPGNSGGPAFNMAGEVIALNTAIVSPTGGSVGLGFAIPSEIAAQIVDDLRAKGHVDRGWLGVTLDAPKRANGGAVIATIAADGPATAAGIRPHDIVVAINGALVTAPRDLILSVARIAPGGVARLKLRRGKQMLDIALPLGRRPADLNAPAVPP
jgi:serine protease Do